MGAMSSLYNHEVVHRAAFGSWGGKRATLEPKPDLPLQWKREHFGSWGGKRTSEIPDMALRAFGQWGGKRDAAFGSWGGKRDSAFGSWGGKRSISGPGYAGGIYQSSLLEEPSQHDLVPTWNKKKLLLKSTETDKSDYDNDNINSE